jgi:ABC-type multidrug transport system ATPase subunit
LFDRENFNYFASIILLQAVEESLKSLNLYHGGISDKQAGKYSGGMKWMLSVAILLIEDPRVCFSFQPI